MGVVTGLSIGPTYRRGSGARARHARSDELSDHRTGHLRTVAAAVHLPDGEFQAAGWHDARTGDRRELLRTDRGAVRLHTAGSRQTSSRSSRCQARRVCPPTWRRPRRPRGATVNFIVRVETGTMNRGIYQNAILFDPTVRSHRRRRSRRRKAGTVVCSRFTAAAAPAAGTSRARRRARPSSIRSGSRRVTRCSSTR